MTERLHALLEIDLRITPVQTPFGASVETRVCYVVAVSTAEEVLSRMRIGSEIIFGINHTYSRGTITAVTGARLLHEKTKQLLRTINLSTIFPPEPAIAMRGETPPHTH